MTKRLTSRSNGSRLPRLSSRLKVAIDALASGDANSITKAAAIAGLSRVHLSRSLSLPHVQTYLESKARRTLAIATPRAAAVKAELLGSFSDHVKDNAATWILELAGIKPAEQPSVSVNVGIVPGYVLDLREPEDVGGPVHLEGNAILPGPPR